MRLSTDQENVLLGIRVEICASWFLKPHCEARGDLSCVFIRHAVVPANILKSAWNVNIYCTGLHVAFSDFTDLDHLQGLFSKVISF